MRVEKIAGYLKNLIAIEASCVEITGAAIDSRLVEEGNIFFAFKGSGADGNKYASDALKKGASIVIMDDPEEYGKVSGNKALVLDSRGAVYDMAEKRAHDINVLKIAVTGSYGKTGTKDMLYDVLSTKFKVQASAGNYNNMLGLSITICGINDNTEIAVFELGSNAMGEIASLAGLIHPDIAVLTGLGYAHVGQFGSMPQIAYEKLTLVDYLAFDGKVAANEQFAVGLALKKNIKQVVTAGNGAGVNLKIDYKIENDSLLFSINDEEYIINYPYPHLAQNFALAVAVGKMLAVPYEDMKGAAKGYSPRKGRGNLIKAGELVIIDETYNASLEAVKSTLNSLKMFSVEPKYFLMGDIFEITGYEAVIYSEIIAMAKENREIKFILSGSPYGKYDVSGFSNITVAQAEDETVRALSEITSGIIAIKASRGCAFENYRDMLIERFGGENAL